MIDLIEVTKSFPTDFWNKPFLALDKVSFSIPSNKIVGFLGANGAGKTTSIKVIMNFINPTSGKVKFSEAFEGKDHRSILSEIGFVPERPYFYANLTGREFLHYMGSLNKMPKAQINTQIERWSTRLKIDFALDRKIQNYSKGMLQRLGFSAALIHDPKLVILDEPVSGLDPIGRKEIKDSIVEIYKEGKTVFFSSHIVPDVEEICHSVIFLEKGKLVYQGSIDELILKHANSDFTFQYFNAGETKLSKLRIPFNEKDEKLKSILASGASLISLQQEKITLEEIFYKVKGKEREMSHD